MLDAQDYSNLFWAIQLTTGVLLALSYWLLRR